MSFAERTPGIRTVAAPIFGPADRVVGCLSLSGPETRMLRQRMNDLAPRVSQAAWTVSELLGATPESVARCRTAAEDLS
jgi:IclR family acetate operon transcriptional repressor